MSTETQIAIRLPKPQNDAAGALIQVADRLLAGLQGSSQMDKNSFMHAMIVAANEADIGRCTPASVMMCAYNSVRLGLPPGKAQGLCYFVPFKNRKTNITECTLIVGFRGWIDLAQRNNFLLSVEVDVATREEQERGDFQFWRDETGSRLKHRPDLDRTATRENIVCAYVVAQLANGGKQVVAVPAAKIRAVAKDTDPWKYAFEEMAKKTALHRAAKLWRLTPQLALAAALDDAVEADLPQPRVSGGEPFDDAAKPAKSFSLADMTGDDGEPEDAHMVALNSIDERWRKMFQKRDGESDEAYGARFLAWANRVGECKAILPPELTHDAIEKCDISLREMESN